MRAALFDLDGTLADSAPDIAAALNAALIEADFEPFDLAAATRMVGAGARKLVERALAARGAAASAQLVDQLHARFIAHYHANPCVHTKLYPGAAQALAALTDDGWALAICTNKPQALADEVVSALGLAATFRAVIGGRDGVALKPAADMVRLALASAGATADRSVFIGDSRADLGAGRAAGLPVILMTHGYSDEPVGSMGADAVTAGFSELVPAMRRLVG